jgi:hypothetical protein
MVGQQPPSCKEEHTHRGLGLYERQVRPQGEAGNRGKVVRSDFQTADFEVAKDTLTAADRLLARHHDACHSPILARSLGRNASSAGDTNRPAAFIPARMSWALSQ